MEKYINTNEKIIRIIRMSPIRNRGSRRDSGVKN